MTNSTTAIPVPQVRAERCAACNRVLVRDSGTDVPHIGIVGPECRHRFGPLLQALSDIEGLTFPLHQGGQRLAHLALCTLHHSGLDVRKVVDLQAGTLRLVVGEMRRGHTGAGVLAAWRDRRPRWEQQLQLAQAEQDGYEGMEASVMLSSRSGARAVGL